jgi:tetratricopeptide (TPR) repeat protein
MGSELAAGCLFAERFEVVCAAGSGGMGTVYRARDRETGRAVGLKLLEKSGRDDAERFAREAQLLSELHHPGIVSYIAHGSAASGSRFLVMEWLEGEDLEQRLLRGPLSVRDCLSLLEQITAALAVAHRRGVVHRDIKPSNVFLIEGDLLRAKLIDFGVARRVNRSLIVTDPGLVVGTPQYMAPEQARGTANLTCAADVFALGCVLYECLTGQPPFSADHIAAVLCRILLEEPTPLSRICPNAPEPLCHLVERMLAKSPSARLPDAAAVAVELATLSECIPAKDSGAALAATLLVPACALRKGPAAAPVLASEQVLMSIVLARSSPPPVDRLGPTLEPKADSGLATVERLLSQVGARAHFLVEGTIVVTLPTRGSARDQVALAARTALLLRDQLPDTSLIVLTGRGTRERTQVVGNLVELGMHLLIDAESQGSAAGILLDPLSAQLISPRFRTEHTARRVYLHGEDIDADDTRLLLGQPTPCLGREVELSSLDAALKTCIEESERQVVVVSGASGEGKSRLRHELVRRIVQNGPPCVVLSMRGEPAALPYMVLRHALRRHCQIPDGASPELQLSQLRARLPIGSTPAPRLLDFLAELLGISMPPLDTPARRAADQDPRLLRDQLRWAFAELLRESCKRQPLLLILDDMQWCDGATLDLIDHAAFALQDAPLFVMALGRPDFTSAHPELFRAHRPRHLVLGRLGRKACERLIRQVIASARPDLLTDELVARLIKQSDRNALYLEELIRAAVEFPEENHPKAVLAMLQARMGVLETEERHVILLASVLGHQFSTRDLLALKSTDVDDSSLQTRLGALQKAELIEPFSDGSSQSVPCEFVFRNELVRQAAYDLIPTSERGALHRRVASYLADTHPSASLRIGSHWLQAEEKDAAIFWLHRATEQALDGHDLEETIRIAEAAISAGAMGDDLGHLRALQATAAFWQSSYQQCQRWALSALPIIRRGSAAFFRLLADAFIASSRLGDQAAVERLEREAVRVDPEPDARDEQLICLARTSFHFLIGQDLQRADPLLQRLTAGLAADRIPAPLVRAQIAHAFGMRAAMLGNMAGYAEKLVDVVAAFDEAGDLRNAYIETTTLAIALLQLGQGEEAESLCRENLARCERLRAHQATHYAKLTLGLILIRRQHHLAQAHGLLSDARRAYESIGHRRRIGLAQGYLALLFLHEQKLGDAEQAAQKAVSQLAESGGFHTWALALHADILLAAGRPGEALTLAQTAVNQLHQAGGAPLMELLPLAVLGETLCALARHEEARRVAQSALARLHSRVSQISSPAWRAGYLALPEQARLRTLMRNLGEPDLVPEPRDQSAEAFDATC